MPHTVHVVFSRRPESVPEDEYNAWYGRHIAEILALPGFAAATRYALVPALDEPAEPDNFTHAAIYEIEGNVADAMAALDAEVASGRMNLPDWFGQIRFSSWQAAPLGPLVSAQA
jgi:hypothetical protein